MSDESTAKRERSEVAFLPFEQARAFVRTLGLTTFGQWLDYQRGRLPGLVKPPDIPLVPHYTYRDDGWQGYGDWLGTGRISNRQKHHQYWPYQKAQEWVREHLRGRVTNWRTYCAGGYPDLPKRPAGIPLHPNRSYAGQGWTSHDVFLGVPTRRDFCNFRLARTFARSLRLPTQAAWKAYVRGPLPDLRPLPANIPHSPESVYKEWISWPNWLGNSPPRYAKLHKLAVSLGLTSRLQWKAYCRGLRPDLPPPLPHTPLLPHVVYKDRGWTDWWQFLGKPRVVKKGKRLTGKGS
jgi:hypothetical protein